MFRCRGATSAAMCVALLAASSATFAYTAPAEPPTKAATTEQKKETSATASTAVSTCTGVLGVAKVNLDDPLSADAVCTSLENTIKAAVGSQYKTSAVKTVIYSGEDAKFYESLSKSIKKYGASTMVTVDLMGDKAPVVTTRTIQAAAAPDFREIGLGIWLDRIEDPEFNKGSPGKVCTKATDEGVGAAAAPYLVNFFLKTVLPWAINKYKAANAYNGARKVDAVLRYTSSGAQKNRITSIEFHPRSDKACG